MKMRRRVTRKLQWCSRRNSIQGVESWQPKTSGMAHKRTTKRWPILSGDWNGFSSGPMVTAQYWLRQEQHYSVGNFRRDRSTTSWIPLLCQEQQTTKVLVLQQMQRRNDWLRSRDTANILPKISESMEARLRRKVPSSFKEHKGWGVWAQGVSSAAVIAGSWPHSS